jgi:hypothetical protein
MQLRNRKAKGTILVALINGCLGGLSTILAIQLYRRLGWSIFASMPVISVPFMVAALPVTSRIRRRFSDGTDQSSPIDRSRCKTEISLEQSSSWERSEGAFWLPPGRKVYLMWFCPGASA